MLTQYDTIFEDFLINIALTKSQAQRIDSSLVGLSTVFLQAFEGDLEIYIQGSFATNTIVKPLTSEQSPSGQAGEYDVDMVFERSGWGGAREALGEVRETIEGSDRYASLLQPSTKQSCERIEYAPDQSGVGFHVDLVPIKAAPEVSRKVAIRNEDIWKPSDPNTIINWFRDLNVTNSYLPAVVLCLKRMRDVAGLQPTIPSIIILALAGVLYEEKDSYADDLLFLLNEINDTLSQSTVSINIPGVNENLAEKWDESQLNEVRTFFQEAYDDLNQAFSNNDLITARAYLSEDFPAEKYLEDLHSLRSKGLKIRLDGSLERPAITPIPEPKDFNRKTRRLLKFTRHGAPVIFNAEPYTLGENQVVKWQVLNARDSDQIRGNFFFAKNASHKTSGNDFQNHETVKYKGLHWIRYFIIDEETTTVDVASMKYFVHLESNE